VLDLESQDSIRSPAEYFARARAEGPVQWSEAHRAWLVLDHAEVADAFRDSERLSADRVAPLERVAADRPAAFAQVLELLRGWMVFRDPPQHTRLRAPVRNAFTPRRVDDLSDLVSGVVEDVLASLPEGSFEVRRHFAGPLPALVIAAVLGVDGDERENFQRWSDDLATVVFSTTPSTVPSDTAIRATQEFSDFFGRLIEEERSAPSGSLLSHLISEADDDLSALELVGACTLLLFAGHETTTSLLTNAIGLLLERPDLLSWLRDHPEADAGAVEEFLRVLGPTRTMFRKAIVDHERGGRAIKAGDSLALAMCAANHDEKVFTHPERIDLTRSPNHHLTFGWGLHHCVGAHLARLEARLALRALLDRFDDLAAVGPVPPITGTVLGYAREPIVVTVNA
jgi:cytochrome P450